MWDLMLLVPDYCLYLTFAKIRPQSDVAELGVLPVPVSTPPSFNTQICNKIEKALNQTKSL